MRFVTVRILKFCLDMPGLRPSHPLSHWELNGCLSFWQITRESRSHKRAHKRESKGFIPVWDNWSVTPQKQNSGNRRSFLRGSILMIPHGSIVSCRKEVCFGWEVKGITSHSALNRISTSCRRTQPGRRTLYSNGRDRPSIKSSHSGIDFLNSLFRDSAARYDFSTLLRLSKSSDAETARRLWDDVWQGRITNDTFITLRRAIMNRFDLQHMIAENVKRTRNRISRRRRLSLVEEKESHPFVGNWHLIPRPELPDDLLETEERRKDRVRLLLDRYGILFRELLQKEWPTLRWSAIFRALRIMELSGEVISGIFFHGIPGPQFISQKAFRRLQQNLPEETIFWINAADPVSLCGVQIDCLRGMLPPRVASTHLVYRGKNLKVVSKRNGKDLSFLRSLQ